MSAYFAFLRHGDYHQAEGAPSARQPWPLTEKGLAQAREGGAALARMIAAHGLTVAPVLHCSHQLRAWQTAQALRAALAPDGHDLIVRETAALGERSLGSAANLTVAQIEDALARDPRHSAPPPGWKARADYRLPLEGAESLDDAGARVAAHLEAHLVPGRLVIHVGHGASFRHACVRLGLLGAGDLPRLSMHHARPSLFCHDLHGRWRRVEGAWKVRSAQKDAAD